MVENPPFPAATARRDFIKTAVIGAAAGSLSVGPLATAGAQAAASDIITRKIPKTGRWPRTAWCAGTERQVARDGMAAMIFSLPPQFRQCSRSRSTPA